MSAKKYNLIRLWSKVFLFTLLLVLVIQMFLVQSYTVSSSQMQNVYYKGDRILVNKTAYGIRMPITPLFVPFTYDNFLGFKSYADKPKLDYRRFFRKALNKNDIVVFNNPLDISKPLDRRELLISRCIAVGGDTLSFSSDLFYVNGIEYVMSPDAVFSYKIQNELADSVFGFMKNHKIDIPKSSSDSVWTYFNLSRYEYFLIDQDIREQITLNMTYPLSDSLTIVVPFRGMLLNLDELTIPLYASAIMNENPDIKLSGNKLISNGTAISSYIFKDNYYWFLSDNVQSSVDSRMIGVVSEKNIIGRPFFVWYRASNKTSTIF